MGTVFTIAPSGTETVLYSFGPGSGDGANPVAGLINVNGTLYGTTLNGGTNGDGTVFSITPSGTETVLYSFGTGSQDGTSPFAGLANVGGTLYGTTNSGGRELPLGKQRLRNGLLNHDVRQGNRAAQLRQLRRRPVPRMRGLVNVNGKLYGTTLNGPTISAAKRLWNGFLDYAVRQGKRAS